jgi:PAS domain S-box-containing protein
MHGGVSLSVDLNTFLELSTDLCCATELDGRILATNTSWFTVLGYGVKELDTTCFFDLVHPDDRARAELEMTRHARSVFAARLRAKDGSYRLLRWSAVALMETKKVYAIGRAEPISLASSERLLSLGQMALGVVHDLKNVLVHPLSLHLQRMERAIEAQSSERTKRSITAMRDVLNDGIEAIDRMLQFAQPGKGTRAKVDVENIVWRATEIARAYARSLDCKQDIEVIYEQGKAKKLECDAFELLAALVNVLFNALDAVAAEGGTVTVRTGVTQKRVWIEVVDDGPGMADDVSQRIFEPFFTTKSDGIGIGLAMVKTCIESHNGSIALTSSPGQGTTFRIELPTQ